MGTHLAIKRVTMKKTLHFEKLDGLTRKTKLKITRETVRVLNQQELTAVAGGNPNVKAAVNSDWCSVGQFVGGCR